MKKKICGQCNKEFEGDLEKCPICGKNLFDKVAEIQVAVIAQDTELYPEIDKDADKKIDKEE